MCVCVCVCAGFRVDCPQVGQIARGRRKQRGRENANPAVYDYIGTRTACAYAHVQPHREFACAHTHTPHWCRRPSQRASRRREERGRGSRRAHGVWMRAGRERPSPEAGCPLCCAATTGADSQQCQESARSQGEDPRHCVCCGRVTEPSGVCVWVCVWAVRCGWVWECCTEDMRARQQPQE